MGGDVTNDIVRRVGEPDPVIAFSVARTCPSIRQRVVPERDHATDPIWTVPNSGNGADWLIKDLFQRFLKTSVRRNKCLDGIECDLLHNSGSIQRASFYAFKVK